MPKGTRIQWWQDRMSADDLSNHPALTDEEDGAAVAIESGIPFDAMTSKEKRGVIRLVRRGRVSIMTLVYRRPV